ncbi:hypothetical protein MKW92_041585, partial [Papaver armeniacum]
VCNKLICFLPASGFFIDENLSMNLSSPDFEDQAPTYNLEQSVVPPSLQLAIRSNTLHMLIKQLRKRCEKGTLYKHELSVEPYIYNGSGHGDGGGA